MNRVFVKNVIQSALRIERFGFHSPVFTTEHFYYLLQSGSQVSGARSTIFCFFRRCLLSPPPPVFQLVVVAFVLIHDICCLILSSPGVIYTTLRLVRGVQLSTGDRDQVEVLFTCLPVASSQLDIIVCDDVCFGVVESRLNCLTCCMQPSEGLGGGGYAPGQGRGRDCLYDSMSVLLWYHPIG